MVQSTHTCACVHTPSGGTPLNYISPGLGCGCHQSLCQGGVVVSNRRKPFLMTAASPSPSRKCICTSFLVRRCTPYLCHAEPCPMFGVSGPQQCPVASSERALCPSFPRRRLLLHHQQPESPESSSHCGDLICQLGLGQCRPHLPASPGTLSGTSFYSILWGLT